MKKMFLTRRPLEKEKEFKGTEEKFLKIQRCFCKRWELNGKTHREDGPAAIYPDGYQVWCQNGELHRIDGPSIAWKNGFKCWHFEGFNLAHLFPISHTLRNKDKNHLFHPA